VASAQASPAGPEIIGQPDPTFVQIAAVDPGVPASSPLSEASDEPEKTAPTSSAPAEALHAGTAHVATIVTAVNSLASAGPSALIAAPLTGLVFPLAGMSLGSAAAGAGGWQHLADQLFQTLGRSSDNDALLVAGVPILERAVAGQPVPARSTGDNLDGQSGNESGFDIDRPGLPLSAVSGAAERRESIPRQAPSAPQENDAGVLDQLFAQAAEDADLMLGDD
jgi:hypothetical protein